MTTSKREMGNVEGDAGPSETLDPFRSERAGRRR
jgi:hypothetical protein